MSISTEEKAVGPEKLQIDVDVQEKGSCERHIKVTIARNEVDRYLDDAIKDIHEQAHVPGFRAGKAPVSLIRKRFKKEIGEQVKQTLLSESLQQVSELADLTPISEPSFNVESVVIPDAGDFTFEFDLEVRPNFDVPDWHGLKIERPIYEFTDKDVDEALDSVLEEHGTLVPKEAPAASGDYIVAKLDIKNGDVIVSAAPSETLCLRSELSFHDAKVLDFDTQMSGVSAGETRTLPIQLSPEAAAAFPSGTKLIVEILVQEVKSFSRPELTATFLREELGYETLGDLRDGILDQLKANLVYEQHQRARQQVTAALTVSANWSLPPELLKKHTQRELQRSVLELQRSGYADNAIRQRINEMRYDSQARISQSLKEHFILEKIAEVENIEVSEADYDSEIREIAMQSGQTPRRVRSQLDKEGGLDVLHNQIIERKVIEMILAEATFKDVPYKITVQDAEAIDRSASEEHFSGIAEATEEDAKAAAREAIERKYIDPNAK